MKQKFIILTVLALSAFTAVQSKTITEREAKAIAESFNAQSNTKFTTESAIKLQPAHEGRSTSGETDYYVFNREGNNGYIVISGDDRTAPVIAYCDHGTFDVLTLPENVKWWFDQYQDQMQFLRNHPECQALHTTNLASAVAPLLSTSWGQTIPFNNFCPQAPSKTDTYLNYGGRATAGCVATAVAQIMKYYNWPKYSTGICTYNCLVKYYDAENARYKSKYIPIDVDLSQSCYQWDLMVDNYYQVIDDNGYATACIMDQNGDYIPAGANGDAVALLIYNLGIAAKMRYSCSEQGGSSTNDGLLAYALEKHFFYDPGTIYARDSIEAEYNEDGVWDNMLRQELEASRPVFYEGSTSGNSGHAFVIDGYDDQGRFHVNWGWNGRYDGYYVTTLLKPSSNYTNGHRAIFGLHPVAMNTLHASISASGFGEVIVGNHSTRIITVNGENLDQDVSLTLEGEDAEQFRIIDSFDGTLANDSAGFKVKVMYSPTTTGHHTARLIITAGQDIAPDTLMLNGTGLLSCDVNCDGIVDIDDVTTLIQHILVGNVPNLCFSTADTNTDGDIDIQDVVNIIGVVLGNGDIPNLSDGLIAYYPFNGNSLDESGHDYHGSVANAILTDGIDGDANGAFAIGGANDPGHIFVSEPTPNPFTDGFTFSGYFKMAEIEAGDHIKQCIFADTQGLGIYCSANPSGITVQATASSANGNWLNLSGDLPITSSEWLHIVLTCSRTTASLYVNGRLMNQEAISPDVPHLCGGDIYLGSNSGDTTPAHGTIDELRIYNRAIKQEDATMLSREQDALEEFCITPSQVVMEWNDTVSVNLNYGSGDYTIISDNHLVDCAVEDGKILIMGKGLGLNDTLTVIDNGAHQQRILTVQSWRPPVLRHDTTFTVNGVDFKMIFVERGTYIMGPTEEEAKNTPEYLWYFAPPHEVTIYSFSIGETEVTEELWEAVMGYNPSYYNEVHGYEPDPHLPIENVSWNDCQAFITKLNELTGMRFRLPTEAEWEYAARGGNQTHYYRYSGSNNPDDVAWYAQNISPSMPMPVATKMPNELGLYDMSGNVSELCFDPYDSEPGTSPVDPINDSTMYPNQHSLRGGGFIIYEVLNLSVFVRGRITNQDDKSTSMGLRIAL